MRMLPAQQYYSDLKIRLLFSPVTARGNLPTPAISIPEFGISLLPGGFLAGKRLIFRKERDALAWDRRRICQVVCRCALRRTRRRLFGTDCHCESLGVPALSRDMDASATVVAPPVAKLPFAPNHRWDRNAFLGFVGLAWLGILFGFGGDIAAHVSKHDAAYPLIVHVHAAVFTGWLVLFTVQVLLIRWRRLDLHRQLGMAMVGVAAAMVFLGPATALHTQHLRAGQPGADPAFLSVQFTDILAFVGFVTTGILWRKSPATHKRLMLLGTLYITDAGFARWLADPLIARFGTGFTGMWIGLYSAVFGVMLLLGAYDLVTRRRLHPAYVAGLAWTLACQCLALALYGSPWWLDSAKGIIAHAW